MPKPILLEVMKARAGIPTNDLFAMLWAQKLRAGSSSVQTLTGIPPLSFKSDGSPLISWSMKGNGQQAGTPTPDNPVMPTFCGVRTENLFDYTRTEDIIDNTYIRKSDGVFVTDTGYYISYPIYVTENVAYTWRFDSKATHSAPTVGFYDALDNMIGTASHGNGLTFFSFTTPTGCKYIRASVYKYLNREAMLNIGNTALPYEPFGYKIPISCAGQTTPIYLGQTNRTRKILKRVLDGSETWDNAYGASLFGMVETLTVPFIQGADALCTHYTYNPVQSGLDAAMSHGEFALQKSQFQYKLFFKNTDFTSAPDFKAWLAAEYAAGRPVTVWYARETAAFGMVNEPFAKIGDYFDELSSTDAGVSIPTVKGSNTLTVETELQPSEMTVTYKG